jgi:hypothetical protein
MAEGYVCPECGLDYDSLDPVGIGARIRPVGSAVRTRIADLDTHTLRTRPEPTVWSVAEYAGHLADAYDAFVDMVPQLQSGADMHDFFWDPDERAIQQGYNTQPVASLLDVLDANCDRLAAAFDELPANDWALTGQFSWGERDLLTMARNAVHEGVHHTQDIDRVTARVSAASQ